MAASRFDFLGFVPCFVVETAETKFSLPPSEVCIRRNGIEIRSPDAFPVWTEMTVQLKSPGGSGVIHCTGVVVACDGNRHSGYAVSLLFLNLSKTSQERLQAMALARLS